LGKCQGLLARFEEEVYRRNGSDSPSDEPSVEEEEDVPPPALRPITPLRPVRARGRRPRTAGVAVRSLNSDREA